MKVICIAPFDAYSEKLTRELCVEWRPILMDNSGSNPLKDLRLFYQLLKYYRQYRPVTVLHFTIKNNIYGTWAARLLGIPSINNVSGLGTAFIHRGLVSTVVRMLYKTSQPFAHLVFCQNEEDMEQLVASKLVPRERLELLPGSGVDLGKFTPRLKKAHTGPFRFLYAGRMLADKGLHELIAAVRSINATGVQCVLWLSGFADVENVSSISLAQLESWARETSIEWLGPSDTMEVLYAQVDCVVLPSYREGMPRSLLEAGAMGLPVVATDVPGCRNIVENGFNGLLCEVKSSYFLEQVMRKMLAMSKQDRNIMGENGRKLVSEKYSEQLVIEATLRAIESSGRGTPRV